MPSLPRSVLLMFTCLTIQTEDDQRCAAETVDKHRIIEPGIKRGKCGQQTEKNPHRKLERDVSTSAPAPNCGVHVP